VCDSFCQIRGSARAAHPRFERDSETAGCRYTDFDCEGVPFLSTHEGPYGVPPLFLGQWEVQNRTGVATHTNPLDEMVATQGCYINNSTMSEAYFSMDSSNLTWLLSRVIEYRG